MQDDLDGFGDGGSISEPVLCIISVYRPNLVPRATQIFAATTNVEVIVDRRVGERRRPERAESEESRVRDRRRYQADEQLRTQGFAIMLREG